MLLDNPSKRSLQRKVLGRIIRHPHHKDPMTVVCLPSQSCWDIKFFSSFPRVERIIAIERDPEVAQTIREKTAGNSKVVEVYEGTTTGWLATTEEKVDLLYFDYCSNFNLTVLQDFQLVFRRRVLKEKGKCVVAFLGARESESDQIAQRLLFEDFNERVSGGEEWGDMEPHRRRCVAFNSFLARGRFEPIRPMAGGHPDRVFALTCAAKWYSYPTEPGVPMLVGNFTLNSYSRKSSGIYPITTSMDVWLVRGARGIREIRRGNFSGMGSVEGAGFVCDIYRRRILEFYEKKGYTPQQLDLGKTSVANWTGLIREVGLCPRTGASLEDLKGEIQRIYDRDGIVTWDALSRAKIRKRNQLSTPAQLRGILDEMGLLHRAYSARRREIDLVLLKVLRAYVTTIENGGNRTGFHRYSYLRKKGLHNYGEAVRELRRLEKVWGLEVDLSEIPGPSQSRTTTGNRMINNGKVTRVVQPDEAELLLREGWVAGRLPKRI